MNEDWFVRVQEFVCHGCGRFMIAFGALDMAHPICGACMTQPGWTMWPDLVRAFDPENDRDTAAITMTVSELECRAELATALFDWLGQNVKIVEDYRPPEALEQKWLH